MQKYSSHDQLGKMTEAIKDIVNVLPELPDNPNINRINDKYFSVGIETVNLDPKLSLSPFYLDYRAQYRFILKRLPELSPYDSMDMFSSIINTKHYYYGGCSYHFHPDVINNIRNAVPELNGLKLNKKIVAQGK